MNRFFPEVSTKIAYEGAASRNPLAFRYFNPEQVVNGKTMQDHLRFAVAYWHTFKGSGQDPFGGASFERPWNRFSSDMDVAKATCEATFEFVTKLGVHYYCFHDRDLAPEGQTFSESCKNLEAMATLAKPFQEQTGIKLLWGTANLFGNPRYTHGAGTNPDVHVFAYAAAQIKHPRTWLDPGGDDLEIEAHLFSFGGHHLKILRSGFPAACQESGRHRDRSLPRFRRS